MKKLLIFILLPLCILVFLMTSHVYAQGETVAPTESTTTPATERAKPIRRTLEKERGAKEKTGQGAMRKLAGKGNRVHLVGAKVTAVGDGTLTVQKDDKTYTVNTDTKTKFRRHFWGKSDLREFSVGDMVNIWGTWADDTQTTINALMIRNLSIMKRHGVFFGTIKSLGDNSFVISSVNRGDQTVTVATTTKYINRREQVITFVDLKAGHRVRIKGLWDKSEKTVSDIVQVKDFSLPPHAEKTTTITPTVTETPVK